QESATLYSSHSSTYYLNAQYNPAVRQNHAWGRKITLQKGTYRFYLNTSDSAEFELYIYRDIPDIRGEPVLLASTMPRNTSLFGTPTNKYINFVAPYDGLYYLVVKCLYGNGTFTIDSEKINNAPIVTINSPKGGIFSDIIEINASVSSSNPVANVYLDIDGKPIGKLVKSGNCWVTSINTNSLTAVNHTITVWAEDTAGYLGRASTNILVVRSIEWSASGLEIANTWEGITNYAWCGIPGVGYYPSEANMNFTLTIPSQNYNSLNFELRHAFNLEENYDYGIIYVNANGSFVEYARFTGNATFRVDRFEISNITSSQIHITFSLRSDSSTQYIGWFIDWVRVSRNGLPLYFNDLNSDTSWNLSVGSYWRSVSLTWGISEESIIFKSTPLGKYLNNVHASIVAFFSGATDQLIVNIRGSGYLELDYDFILLVSSNDLGFSWSLDDYSSEPASLKVSYTPKGIIGLKLTVYTDASVTTNGLTINSITVSLFPIWSIVLAVVIVAAVGIVIVLVIIKIIKKRREAQGYGFGYGAPPVIPPSFPEETIPGAYGIYSVNQEEKRRDEDYPYYP
ncbi:MAG: hypothetical protein QXL15_02885, partial [Candidatus Korarchaeota archaeon]